MNAERKNRAAGFTLIEVFIVVAILAIVATISIPNIRKMLPNYRLKGAARQLFSDMQRARSEAIKRNTNVGIAFDTNNNSYTVFLDDGSGAGGTSGNATQDGDEPDLYTVGMPRDCTLYEADFGGGTTVGYNSKGLPLSGLSGHARMRNNQSRWYQVRLSSAGLPKITISGDGTF